MAYRRLCERMERTPMLALAFALIAFPAIAGESSPAPPRLLIADEMRMTAYTTGYSYWDNTPPGSADISNGVIHEKAGGAGTFGDPITVAVGHVISDGNDTLDYAAGTKFYVPNLRRYFIVEDSCGDGDTPQDGPCHTGYEGHPWIDLYVDGANTSKEISDACMDAVTDLHLVIMNPAPNYPVVTGPVTDNCVQYGDTVVAQ
jgi:hypothetical protein